MENESKTFNNLTPGERFDITFGVKPHFEETEEDYHPYELVGYSSVEDASQAIKDGQLPLGVVIEEKQNDDSIKILFYPEDWPL